MFFALLLGFFLLGMLTHSALSTYYASMGLKLWMEAMLPALLPFMILSGILVRTGMANRLTGFLSPVLGRVFHTSPAGLYTIFVGFLCGFPMGARTIAQLYMRGELDQKESSWLLAFCNNLGPAYLLGFVMPLLGIEHPLLLLTGAYVIPMIYGFLLRKTIYRGAFIPRNTTASSCSFFAALEEAVSSSMQGMIILCGYTILFCLCNLIPILLTGKECPFFSPLFEISTGLKLMQGKHPLYLLFFFCFGGCSCIAQTYSALQETGLQTKLAEYVLHKLLQSVMTVLYFYGISLLFPDFLPG